jgi:prolyl-tRNA synthetase
MYWKKYFIPTMKETPVGTEAVSHQLLLRAGLVNMLTSGVYSYLPLGLRVLKRIEGIIRQEMNAIGALELFLPCLQPMEIWQATGRDQVMRDIMLRFRDKKNRDICLGPTHEEVITNLVKQYVQSYRQLPVTLYQIQTKFRDELRTRFGIVRACEFIMKDAYSFDRDADGLKKNYELMYEAYQKILRRCGLPFVIITADSGAMGGDISHEFLVPAPIGEDALLQCRACSYALGYEEDQSGASCPSCQKGILEKRIAIELGHVFQLGTKYSQALGAVFIDENGKQQPIIMGCYGIGVSRLISAVIEVHNDQAGIVWPREVAPFDVEIIPLIDEAEIQRLSVDYHDTLERAGMEVLVDDREESAGRKFNDADLIGLPYRIILGKRTKKDQVVEIKQRRSGQTWVVAKDRLANEFLRIREESPECAAA